MVRKLLTDGAYKSNDSIHNMRVEDVVQSITSLRMESLRTAWKEVFYMAFSRQVSEVGSVKEAEYTEEE